MQQVSDKNHILVLDIGGTIEDTWSAKQNWFMKRGIDIGQKPLGRREVEGILGKNKGMYQEMVDEIYSEEGIMSHELVCGSKKAIKELNTYFEIILLSTRQENMRKITVSWLESNGILKFVSDIVFIYELGEVPCTKLETCNNLGGEIIIDDDIRHLTPTNIFPRIQRCLFTANDISIPGINTFQRWETFSGIFDVKFPFWKEIKVSIET